MSSFNLMKPVEDVIPLSALVKSAHCITLAHQSLRHSNNGHDIIQESLQSEKDVLIEKFTQCYEMKEFNSPHFFDMDDSLDSFSLRYGTYKNIHFTYKNISFVVDFMKITDSKILIYNLHPTTKVTFYTLLESLCILHFFSEKTAKPVIFKYVFLSTTFTITDPISHLFVFRTLTKNNIKSKQALLDIILKAPAALKKQEAPVTPIGLHCVKPHDCPFKDTCWPELPIDSVYYTYNMSKKEKFKLMDAGTQHMSSISKDFLTAKQQIQVSCHSKKKVHIQKKDLRKVIQQLAYPLHFIDFEAVHFSYPIFDHIKPFQALPFQFSIHKQATKDKVPIHHYFLGEPGKDPRYQFIKTFLEKIEPTGSIIAFDTHFEIETLVSLAKLYPEFKKQVDLLLSRFIDISTPFQKYYIYSYKMKGKYSLKDILPAFIPDLSYTPLSIASGEVASRAYVLITYLKKEFNKNKMLNQLNEYCFLDTYGLYRLTEKILEFSA